MPSKWHPEKPSSKKSRTELLEENQLLYNEVLASREAAAITANLVVQQFSSMEKINENLARVNDELKKISSLDGLTGVANRRFHDEMLSREWRRCRRNRQWLTLIMIDIDFFKLYNDCYGHPAGDLCLKKVAKSLNSVIHRPTDLLARYGGEEFTYTLSECDKDVAYAIAEKARKAIADMQIHHQESPISKYVSLSLGIASIIPEQSLDYAVLSENADNALYHAKKSGRNCVKVYAEID
jgi:two-component system, chemotaxis family, response regulator WspR